MVKTCRICLQSSDEIKDDISNYLGIVKRVAHIDLIFDGKLSTKVCDECVNDLFNADLLCDMLVKCNEPQLDTSQVVKEESLDDILESYEQDDFLQDHKESIQIPDVILETKTTAVRKTEPKYQCHRCHKLIRHGLLRHMSTEHPDDPLEFKCRYCEKIFDQINNIQTHVHVHHNIVEICEECGASFKRKRNLINHKISIHLKEKNFICDLCNARFATRSGMVKHIRSHTGEKPFKCKYCPKAYSHYSDYKTHELNHTGQWTHYCPICNKGFYKPSILKNHMKIHCNK